jgi:hypothetical protein
VSLPTRAKRRKEPCYLRVLPDGKLAPASDFYERQLLDRYAPGDIIRAELTKPRNPRHHRLVMALLQRVLANQDGLLTIDQLLTVVKIKLGRCVPYVDAGTGKVYYVVESIAFDAMDQAEFETFWADLCKLIARDYFPTLTAEQVAALAEFMDAA